ncbi:hypothetical protein [Brevibacillus brevis]|uniref:hypothetical protein n=1 Tax=Brevibacillus brevis TaxID=1393 RepID=UPI001C8D52F1|nr:hypothetical protein [Brevibacillus brevis]MBY0088439.1 hypothetical protein [Brevibacillus brevis]
MRFVGIDPSTKTGFVALDNQGNVLRRKELTGIGSKDPLRMTTLVDEIMDHVQIGDIICIEGFGFSSQQAIQLGGIGWGVRMALHRKGFQYFEVAPMALKKFCGATGNKGPDGKAIKADKIEVAKQVLKRWGFESGSDNVTDAFVLAKVAEGICMHNADNLVHQYHQFQLEVLSSVLNPPEKKKRQKVSK